MKRAEHIKLSEKQFESRKRQELKRLFKEFYGKDGIMLGSHFLPLIVQFRLHIAFEQVEAARKEYLRLKSHLHKK
jgi:hypothetical protein